VTGTPAMHSVTMLAVMMGAEPHELDAIWDEIASQPVATTPYEAYIAVASAIDTVRSRA
jgi:hypothetical protein